MKSLRLPALAMAVAIGVGACASGAGTSSSPGASTMSMPSMAPSTGSASPAGSMGAAVVDSPAADLRVKLDLLLGEHIIFASKATRAALIGHSEEFAAYGGLLNSNGTDIGEMIGAAFGSAAKDSFNKIWSAHNGFFVDYTTGVATKDQAKMNKAVSDLTTIYVPQFSDLIAGATGLPKDAVVKLTTDHVLQTKQIVDDQAKNDWKAAYADIRLAYAHMSMIGDPIAKAIVAKLPDKFAGDAANKGVDFRVALDNLLQEHLYLATDATAAALEGMSDEFQAAGGALNTNGTDLGAALGSVYGDAAKDGFNKIWSAHNGFFVDYTTGVATKDQAKMDKAVSDLTTMYLPQFADFLATATGLPNDALTALIKEHVVTTKAVVDAQGTKDYAAASKADQTAGRHMEMIGDPLAKAIVAKVPDKFV